MAYSMEFLPRKHMCLSNRLKVILSCRAQWVLFTVNKSALIIVPLRRYRPFKFTWKSLKTKKLENLPNFVIFTFSILYGQKWVPIIYPCSSRSAAFAPISFVNFHWSNKSFFQVTLVVFDKNNSAQTQSLETLLSYITWFDDLVHFVEQTLFYQTLYLEV